MMMANRANSTLSLIANTLADAIKPGGDGTPFVPPAKTAPVVYIADNSRFRPDAALQRERVEALCERYGLRADWPGEHILFPTGLTIAERISIGLPPEDPEPGQLLPRSWRLLGKSDAIVAEITPFRGVHLNPLIAFEIGVAVVHEIPVFAWTTAIYPTPAIYPATPTVSGEPRFRLLSDRMWCGDAVAPDGNWRDEDGNMVENFGLVEFAQIAGNFAALTSSRSEAIRRCAEYLTGKRAG